VLFISIGCLLASFSRRETAISQLDPRRLAAHG
jgi:hypothetical protein